ncbi:MAG: TMEM43 family protein [Planctomycetes bacterium]|nr:TMEM43 family protein [Planctomycetota bacterium]
MAYTTEETTGWFSRLGSSVKGVLVGFILFIAGFPVLFWNEGNYVRTQQSLEKTGQAAITVPADKVDPANDKKPVHIQGVQAVTDERLSDPDFAGTSGSFIKLHRKALMYQWRENIRTETKKEVGGSEKKITTYTYEKVWSDDVIDSGKFNHDAGNTDSAGKVNPPSKKFDSKMFAASKVTAGAFTLSPGLLGQFSNFQPLAIRPASGPASSPAAAPATMRGAAPAGPPPADHAIGTMLKQAGEGYYFGNDPNNPQIGDLKISFEVVKPQPISVLARQVGQTFEPYTPEGETKSVELLSPGTHSKEGMIEQAQAANRMWTWILRLVGFLLMFIGLGMAFKPLSVVGDVIPFIGNLIGAGTGIIAFVIALVCSVITIGIAWLFYRPLWGILMLVAAVGLFVAFKMLRKGKKAQTPAAPAGPTG